MLILHLLRLIIMPKLRSRIPFSMNLDRLFFRDRRVFGLAQAPRALFIVHSKNGNLFIKSYIAEAMLVIKCIQELSKGQLNIF